MLVQIAIQNFLFIEDAKLDFAPGFNVVTGETGAGKSLFLGALTVTLGEKFGPDRIMPGKTLARVTSVFDVTKRPEITERLAALGIAPEEGHITLRREVDLDGKSRSFINDQVFRLGALKELGELLLDLHGQHDNQFLFNSRSHAGLFDRFAGTAEAAETYRTAFRELGRLVESRKELEQKVLDLQKEKDFLQYTLKELDGHVIEEAEYEKLKEAVRQEAQTEKSTRLLQRADEHLGNSRNELGEALAVFHDLARVDPAWDAQVTALKEAQAALDSTADRVADGLSGTGKRVDVDALQARLSRTENLKKKYGLDTAGLLAKLEETRKKLNFLEDVGIEKEDLMKALKAKAAETIALGRDLRQRREEARPKFEQILKDELEFLGMKGARLSCRFTPNTKGIPLTATGESLCLDTDGLDSGEFAYAPVRETSFRNLKDIASGGEISRIMLAFKKVLGADVPAHTLVFDEIDVGIGGQTALNVGRKMAEIAGGRQILVITHLPQIARFAERHFRVLRRIEDAGRTHTHIDLLEGDERVAEIARMLSGATGPGELEFARKFLTGDGT